MPEPARRQAPTSASAQASAAAPTQPQSSPPQAPLLQPLRQQLRGTEEVPPAVCGRAFLRGFGALLREIVLPRSLHARLGIGSSVAESYVRFPVTDPQQVPAFLAQELLRQREVQLSAGM